jgi:hypothetical protein
MNLYLYRYDIAGLALRAIDKSLTVVSRAHRYNGQVAVRSADTCVFCGTKGASLLSEEDVVPKWLKRHLALPSHDETAHFTVDSKTETVIHQHLSSTFRYVERCVCAKHCNNGWMSRLENRAKPILIPLIDSQRAVANLSPPERKDVAKWAAKTAYMHVSASRDVKHHIPGDHLHALSGDSGFMLQGVAVFGMQRRFIKPNAWYKAARWPHVIRQGTSPGSTAVPLDAYKVGLQFRHLYLLVAFWSPSAQFCVAENVHVPIWSVAQRSWRPNPQQFPLRANPVGMLAQFADSLALIHD